MASHMKFRNLFLFLLVPIFFAGRVVAHCPLCTIGAGVAAGAAIYLGVSKVVVALFIGGFAMSMGMWFSKVIKKKYIIFQDAIIIILVFLTTLLPLLPLFGVIGPLYLSFVGKYGTTFAVNYSLYSGLLGGLVVFISPNLNKKITKFRRGEHVPFQGIILTLGILIVMGLIIQFLI